MEKEIKLLRLRDDSKTRPLDIVDFERANRLIAWACETTTGSLSNCYISLLRDCEQVIFHFVENVLPRSSRIVGEKEIV